MTAKYTMDHGGMGEMLRSQFMQDGMRLIAEDITARAEAIAPVGHPPDSEPRPLQSSRSPSAS